MERSRRLPTSLACGSGASILARPPLPLPLPSLRPQDAHGRGHKLAPAPPNVAGCPTWTDTAPSASLLALLLLRRLRDALARALLPDGGRVTRLAGHRHGALKLCRVAAAVLDALIPPVLERLDAVALRAARALRGWVHDEAGPRRDFAFEAADPVERRLPLATRPRLRRGWLRRLLELFLDVLPHELVKCRSAVGLLCLVAAAVAPVERLVVVERSG
mmetsp:Transcript_13626/g.43782  ORF Transcript_13626/g.43782 Transcript_13626/m.43782 type:complete len:218 (+) Transcript_13626:214-867(+)